MTIDQPAESTERINVMSMSNATESDRLDWILKGTDPAWRAGATGYLALGAGSPDEASPLAGELTYTGYALHRHDQGHRLVGQRRPRTNANLLQWPGKAHRRRRQPRRPRTPSGATPPAALSAWR